MKKLTAVIAILTVMIMCLCACDTNTPAEDDGRLRVIATIFPQYDLARQIAGDSADVSMLITPGAESHSYEPTTSDIIRISECDIFIYTGGESDDWIDSMLKSINNPDMTVISLIDCVEDRITVEHTDEDDGYIHSEEDEHIWTSPINCIAVAEKICAQMSIKDTENSESYNNNLRSLVSDLNALDRDFRNVVENAKRNELVFGDRFPLYYFAREYSLDCYSAFSGCSDDTEASAATVASLIDRVKNDNLPVVYKIELSSDSIASTISSETGAEVMIFYSCHNISKEDFENGETYVSMMQRNVESLRLALN